ncbi:hypothetical protein QTP88_029061 [Uroleucon formosanum]
MARIGIPEKLIRMIKTCVQGSKCKVNFGGDYSNEFLVSTGLRQGDALSPVLFNIALESVVRQVLSKAKGIKISDNQQLAIVAYADDLVLTAENEESLKKSAKELIRIGAEIEIEGYSFERVEQFKYLGPWMNENANSHEEIKERLIAANRYYFGLSTLFKSKLLSRRSKITLYEVLIRPIVLYACETWATTEMDENKLGVFERKILRKIYGPKKNDVGEFEVRTNEELRRLFGEANIMGIMKSYRLRWAGHVWRSEGILGTQRDGDRAQNGSEDDPDNGGQIELRKTSE